jgi:hypothetical protein
MLNRDIRDRQKKFYDVGNLSGGGNNMPSNNVSIDSVLHNLEIHLNAYIEDREILYGDITAICKYYPELLHDVRFQKLKAKYNAFERFVNYYVDKYKPQ